MIPAKSLVSALVTAVLLTTVSIATAHPDRGEKRPQTYAEAFIPMTPDEWRREPKFRHPPGNVRAEDMYELFADNVMVVNQGREYARDGSTHNIVTVLFFGKDGRFVWCTWNDPPGQYNLWEHSWAPSKVKHRGTLQHLLDPAIHTNKRPGLGPLYDGATGQLILYVRKGQNKTWVTLDAGHLQKRLPRAVWTLCPDFPSAEELGVGVNEKQTAITYDKLLEQDPGQRILRPDLITLDPTELIE